MVNKIQIKIFALNYYMLIYLKSIVIYQKNIMRHNLKIYNYHKKLKKLITKIMNYK